ncbi:MAG: L,D-transpeptidase, partial [Myxococcales bacterium]|nr:L,D-transpeptidase [Myxococcales bacterium]
MLTARIAALCLLLGACERKDPPGRTADAPPIKSLPRPTALITATASVPTAVASADPSPEANEPGHGAKLASIAMRTWVYDAPAARARKLGYLRAGALIDRAAAPAGTDGCEGGWYRVAPRGYACVGKGASLDEHHPIVLAAARGPRRGE